MKNILRKSLILSLSAVAVFALAPTSLMADKPDSPPGKPTSTPPESPPGNPDVTAPGLEQSPYVKLETKIDLDADGTIDGIYATYEYDENGNLLTKTFDKNADGTTDRIDVSTYDTNGNRSTFSYDLAGDSTFDGIWTFTYDTNGNMLTWSLVTTAGGNTTYDVFTYDENGNMVAQTNYGSYENFKNDRILDKGTNTYDKKGLRTNAEWDWGNDDSIDLIITYTYDNQGNMILISYVGIPNRLITYTYDNKGNMLSMINDYEADGVDDDIKTYSYDGKGNRLTESFDDDANGYADYILYNTWIESN